MSRRLRAQLLRCTRPGWHAPWGVQVGRWCRISIDEGGSIAVGPGVEIDDGVTLAAGRSAEITIGSRSFVGHHSTIAAASRVAIGDGTFLAELVSVRDHDHDEAHPIAAGAQRIGDVAIGDDCWLGSKVTVLRDASIGDGAIIGANSVVRGAIPMNVIAAGAPARAIRERRGETPPHD